MSRDPDRSSFSFTQLAASALAASSAAFAASYLGVTGTIIGAAVASVIATIATATYSASLQRSKDAVLRTAMVARQTGFPPATGAVPDPGAPEPDDDAVTGTRELAIAPEPLIAGAAGQRSGRRTALMATAALVISLGALTGVEGLLGKPLSALLDGSNGTGTSVGSAVTGGGSKSPAKPTQKPSDPAPAPTPTEASEPTPTQAPTIEPSATPTTPPVGSPTADPTGSPTVPLPTPTTPNPTGSPTP